MKKTELSKLAEAGEWDKIIEELFSGTPYAFQKFPAEYDKVRGHLATAQRLSCWLVVGVSDSVWPPHKFGRPFNERSDLDFVIVDATLFDKAWLELIQYDFKTLSIDKELADSLWEHRRNNIFWGYIEPYRVRVVLSFYNKISWLGG
jgi:hypothetical protein